jgi:low affinity Fe/Cu permease
VVFVLNFKPVPFVILVVIGTLLIPIQTSTEEYVFRGYLMGFNDEEQMVSLTDDVNNFSVHFLIQKFQNGDIILCII